MRKNQTLLLAILLLLSLCFTNTACVEQSVRDHTHTFPGSDAAPPQTTKATKQDSTTEPFTATVSRILDGDTIEIQAADNSILKIRLQGIDAPESSQPFGDTAREQLTLFILHKTITIEPNAKDKYGRLIGKVTLNNDDICLKMIKAGQAWWFERYADTQSPNDRLTYSQAEDQSRQQQLGLWSDPNPVPPWTYRHEQQQRQKN